MIKHILFETQMASNRTLLFLTHITQQRVTFWKQVAMAVLTHIGRRGSVLHSMPFSNLITWIQNEKHHCQIFRAGYRTCIPEFSYPLHTCEEISRLSNSCSSSYKKMVLFHELEVQGLSIDGVLGGEKQEEFRNIYYVVFKKNFSISSKLLACFQFLCRLVQFSFSPKRIWERFWERFSTSSIYLQYSI